MGDKRHLATATRSLGCRTPIATRRPVEGLSWRGSVWLCPVSWRLSGPPHLRRSEGFTRVVPSSIFAAGLVLSMFFSGVVLGYRDNARPTERMASKSPSE